MIGRRNLVAGMAGLLATLATGVPAGAGRIEAGPPPAPADEELLHLAQWGYPPPPWRRRRRRPRCWIERRRVAVRDAWGRVRYQWRDVRVCRR